MKAAVILSFVAVAMAGVLEQRHCGGNNCARQVTGTRDGLSPITDRQNDCSSFMIATKVPKPTHVTVTVTVDPDEPYRFKRDDGLEVRALHTPTDIPAYASSCDDGAEYSSVCDCWGITATTTTAKRPTKTHTVTVTADYCEDL